jgi:hypothetical protein
LGLTTLLSKNKIVKKPPRNSAGFCGGGQALNLAVEPKKKEEEEEEEEYKTNVLIPLGLSFCAAQGCILMHILYKPDTDI